MGGENGQLYEVNFEETFIEGAIRFLKNNKRALKLTNRGPSSILSFVLSQFADQKKQVQEIKIDETRNYLYQLSYYVSGNRKDLAAIDVYDLGITADSFQHVTTIHTTAIMEEVMRETNTQFRYRGHDDYQVA